MIIRDILRIAHCWRPRPCEGADHEHQFALEKKEKALSTARLKEAQRLHMPRVTR